MIRAIFCCMLLLPVAAPGRAADADWFEVELILFAREPTAAPGRVGQVGKEQFSFPAPGYPRRLTALTPLDGAAPGALTPGQELALREHAELLREAVPWHLHPAGAGSTPPKVEEVVPRAGYEAEDVLLGLPLAEPEAVPEAEEAQPVLNGMTVAEQILPSLPQPLAWRLRPTKEHRLPGTARRIDQAESLRLLTHLMWRQPVEGLGRGEAILIQAGRQVGDIRELDGYLIIEQARFLHLQLDLWFSRFRAGAKTGQFRQHPGGVRRLPRSVTGRYQFRQSRRLDRNELHYLDHPFLGLLIRIRPVT